MSKKLSKEYQIRLLLSIVSIFAALIILALKYWAYLLTDSTALQSDALESVVNVVSACFTLGAIIFAEKPADEDHPYGHGKIEFFSAAFEGGLISLASVLIFYEAIQSLLYGSPVKQLNLGILLNFSAGILNGTLGFILVKFGRKNRSKAIEADGHHVLSDFYTSIGLLISLILVHWTGFIWLDPIIALLIGCTLAVTGYKLVKESSASLLDKEDPRLIKKLVEKMNQLKPTGIIDVHALRSFRSGRHTHIDIHVAVPEYYPLNQAHDLVDLFGEQVLKSLKIEGEFHAHLDPCRQNYCKLCEVENCSIRKEEFTGSIPLNVERAVARHPQNI